MINLGRVIDHTSHVLAGAYVRNEPAEPAETAYRTFVQTVRAEPLLESEFLVFQNLRRGGLDPALALDYAKANLRQLAGRSQGELARAHQLLEGFVPHAAREANPLDAAIQTLVVEGAAAPGRQRVNAYHQALAVVVDSLARPAPEAAPEVLSEGYSCSELLAGALRPLSEGLAQLSEADRALLFVVTGTDAAEKQALFESYHAQASALLAGYADSPAAECLREMAYNPATVGDDLMDLHALVQPEA